MHLVHINIKYMGMLCKEIFRFQCGPVTAAAAVSGGGANHSKRKSMPAIAGHAQLLNKMISINLQNVFMHKPDLTFVIRTCTSLS